MDDKELRERFNFLVGRLTKPIVFISLPEYKTLDFSNEQSINQFKKHLVHKKEEMNNKIALIANIINTIEELEIIAKLNDETNEDFPFYFLHVSKDDSFETIKDHVSSTLEKLRNLIDSEWKDIKIDERSIEREIELLEFAFYRVKQIKGI